VNRNWQITHGFSAVDASAKNDGSILLRKKTNHLCSGMSDCRPRDGSGVQVHIAHIQGSEKIFRQGRFDDNSGLCAGRVRRRHRNNAHTFVYVLERSVVMQVKGEKELTLTPG
jgi:hypothetical protein